MTDITVTTKQSQVEKRSWLLGPHGTEPGATPSCTLDIAKFTAGTHYPNGYIPSGIVLGEVTATGLMGPYNPDGTDGTETAVGHLFSSVTVNPGSTKVGGAYLVHGFVRRSKLPIASGTDGGLDTAAEADLKHVIYSA
jgi:hypothetical protein